MSKYLTNSRVDYMDYIRFCRDARTDTQGTGRNMRQATARAGSEEGADELLFDINESPGAERVPDDA